MRNCAYATRLILDRRNLDFDVIFHDQIGMFSAENKRSRKAFVSIHFTTSILGVTYVQGGRSFTIIHPDHHLDLFQINSVPVDANFFLRISWKFGF